MPHIHQLPHSVVTKIAAGEVIERPASVVKELLENSVDAGSTRIDVEVEQGGAELIRIVDDGCGIDAEDLPLAFASHATSKLASAEDLFHIRTLGFRGEALASIGGVAQVLLQSRTRERSGGAQLTCNGGELSAVRAWSGAPGTRIEVRHLFYNTPVRRKFLRTTSTEMGHVVEVFTRLALSHPTLHLTLRHNGKEVYQVPASTALRERLRLFYGAEVSDKLHDLEVRQGAVTLSGFIADPACERGNAKMQYLFVNGRCIRDRSLAHALQEAYRGLLMSGRYAVAFLFLELPPELVDVNVHPTKVEVRFRDGQALHHLVFSTIRTRLNALNLTARLQPPVNRSEWRVPSTESLANGTLPLGENKETVVASLPWNSQAAPAYEPQTANVQSRPFQPVERERAEDSLPTGHSPRAPRLPPLAPAQKAIQLYDMYLVLETQAGMLVIDQHALHERILFEELKKRVAVGPLETQRLLIPEPLDLTPEQAAKTLEHREALAELGLGVEDFGGGTVLLTTYPAILGNRPPRSVLEKVVDHLVSKELPPTRDQLLNDLLSLMACHTAVRAGDKLSPEEIASLIARRELADNAHHCPHGRPTALLFSRQELERQFRRV
jgi:DNA mismatch repair protein MutL